MSYSSDGYGVGAGAVVPSTSSFTNPTGACAIVNCPCASVCAAGAPFAAPTFECRTLVRTARTVTPGIGALLLSRTTPEFVVSVGLPGARPDDMKPAAKLWFDGKFAWTKLFALPSCVPRVSVAAARPSG